jgi:hypothetical protein
MQDEIAAVVQEMRDLVVSSRDVSGISENRVWEWADRLSAASSSPGEPTMTVRVIRDGKAEDVTFQRTLPDPPCPLCGSSSAPRETQEDELCRECHGNGVVKIHHGVSVCPRCRGRCWEPASPLGPSAGEGWQPIETAPKDGTTVLLFDPANEEIERGVDVGFFHGGVFEWLWSRDACNGNPTHWMPLPAPPQESSREET